MDSTLILVAAFFGVAALVGAVVFVLRDFGNSTAEDRLEILTGKKSASAGESKGIVKDEFSQGLTGAFRLLGSFGKRFENLAHLFEQADSPVRAEAFFGLTLACAALGVVGAMAGHAPIPLYPVAGLFTSSIPLVWLLLRRKSRFKKFEKQLPDALELIGRALRSGHSLASGLHVVVDEMPTPISSEFALVYEEQNLGIPIDQALKGMLKRIPNMDLKFFVTAVAIQKQAGGNMAEILDKIGYIIRERFKIMGLVQALTGEGRISGVVLMALPVALFIAVYYLNEEYVMLLFQEPLGQKMLAVAAVLQILGAVVIKKIVNIKI